MNVRCTSHKMKDAETFSELEISNIGKFDLRTEQNPVLESEDQKFL